MTAALSVALTWFGKDSVVDWWGRARVELNEQTSERLRSLRINYVDFDGLALRSGPGEHFGTVDRLERFTTVHWMAWADENWVKVRTNDGELGYVNMEFLADGDGDEARADWCSRPAENRANGSVLQQSKLGEHILRVRNGNDDDALVRLKSRAGESVALFYVSARHTAEISNVPNGSYRTEFILGKNFSPICKAYLRAMYFPQPSDFSARTERRSDGIYNITTILEYTLHSVPGGNAAAQAMNVDAFFSN